MTRLALSPHGHIEYPASRCNIGIYILLQVKSVQRRIAIVCELAFILRDNG